MHIHSYLLPYDSARRSERMGAGPQYWVDNGLVEMLQAGGHTVTTKVIEAQTDFPMEIITSFALYGKLAAEIQRDCTDGQTALVLSGNCGASLGTISGLRGRNESPIGVVWFDAHGDFNTPDTSPSGYLDGMCLATAAGLGWKNVASRLPGFRPLAIEHILHIGGRDFDPLEEQLMAERDLPYIPAKQIHERGLRDAVLPGLDALSSRVKAIYLHFDVDVLDPAETPANHYAAPGGLYPAQMLEAVALLRERFQILGMGIASFDPLYDIEGKTLTAVKEITSAALG